MADPGSDTLGRRRAALVYSDEVSRYELSPEHPFKPARYRNVHALCEAAGLFDLPNTRVVPPRAATRAEIESFHTAEYVSAVKAISADPGTPGAARYGFGPGDNPPFRGMYEPLALAAGGSMVAAELVASGEADVAFNIGGGLHHAMPDRASGFCVFNDPVMAINWLVEQGHRVAYVDIDCHHGDGVQYGFYGSDRVLTISLHESGQYLFPGTGHVGETGEGDGEGFAVNVPLAPYTDDETYVSTFDAVVPPLVEAFKPDVLFTQMGIDTHVLDPITHLQLTTQGFARVVERLGRLAAPCGRWIAAGGGGYDLGAVARAWTMAFAVMAEAELPRELPVSLPEFPELSEFPDAAPEPLGPALAAQVRGFAEHSVDRVRELIFPRFGIL